MTIIWIGFFVFVGLLLFLDLFVLNKEDHVPSTREALRWTALWTTIGLSFSGFIYLAYANGWMESPLSGEEALINYLTGYLVELSLSMDNVFVIAVIKSATVTDTSAKNARSRLEPGKLLNAFSFETFR
ncbi:MAG: hypothetical protein AAF840_17585, partial [Bacteroidota bacterium]